ncbi:hypothetical protein QFC21_003339 [Naganishia friedmannii]|uniref:Uncharacterized protein n=1 Tax=Naganishia friedmannii TaxID=89922 RepID=A0ACC2VPS6_9TREE|nr:hypothetical protein QFC21_003339 [Naganishia friedmannii]
MAEVNMQDPGTLLQARLTAPADLTIQAILRGQSVAKVASYDVPQMLQGVNLCEASRHPTHSAM